MPEQQKIKHYSEKVIFDVDGIVQALSISYEFPEGTDKRRFNSFKKNIIGYIINDLNNAVEYLNNYPFPDTDNLDVHFELRAYYYSDESPELLYKNAPKFYQVIPSDLIKLVVRTPPKCKIKTIEIDLNITHKGARLGNSSEFLIDIMNYLNKFTKLISIHKTLKRSKLISDFKVKKK